jgi:hypothetical protein
MKMQELERIAMRDFVREYGAVVHRAPKVVTKLYLSNLDETVTREHIQVLLLLPFFLIFVNLIING